MRLIWIMVLYSASEGSEGFGPSGGEDIEMKKRLVASNNDPDKCRCGRIITKEALKNQEESESRDYGGPVQPPQTSEQKEYTDQDFVPYYPEVRPWLVAIRLEYQNNDFWECAGSLISSEYVITSKACLCKNQVNCSNNDIQALHNTTTSTFVVPHTKYRVGSEPVLNVSTYGINHFARVKSIFLPGEEDTKEITDIAMIQLDPQLRLNSDVMPICLPKPQEEEEEGKKEAKVEEEKSQKTVKEEWAVLDNDTVYIAGFNFYLHRKIEQRDRCYTNGGPAPARRCKDFRWHEKEKAAHGCVFKVPFVHDECEELRKARNWATQIPDGVHRIVINKNLDKFPEEKEKLGNLPNNTLRLECYGDSPGPYGWCGTCNPLAEKGSAGYCGADEELDHSKKLFSSELSLPSAWGGWGFCSPLCEASRGRGIRSKYPTPMEALRVVKQSYKCLDSVDVEGVSEEFAYLCLKFKPVVAHQEVYRMDGTGDFTFDNKGAYKGGKTPQDEIGDSGASVFKLVNQEVSSGYATAVLVGVQRSPEFYPMVITRIDPLIGFIRRILEQQTNLGNDCHTVIS